MSSRKKEKLRVLSTSLDEIALLCPTQAVSLAIIRDCYNDIFNNEIRGKCGSNSKENILSARSDRKSSYNTEKFSNIGSDSYRGELSI